MPKATILLGFVLLAAGCQLADENPDWDPKHDLPSWAYDAPFYYRPTEDLKPVETVGQGIPVYYPRTDYFFLAHPDGYDVTGEPRLAVWCSTDQENWDRCGYFGVEQTHFLMHAEEDGPHWVRFVGPGQGKTEAPPGHPHRIYVVDTQAPEITLTVDPAPFHVNEEGERIPRLYTVGDEVTLSWSVKDANLRDGSVRLSTCWVRFPDNLAWSVWPKPLTARGSIDVVLPPEAALNGGLRFRMEAQDKAGHIGMAVTHALAVHETPGAATRPTVRPVGPFERIPTAAPQPDDDRPGWPRKGALIRGGAQIALKWMPEDVESYEGLAVQFTSNNGLSWRTLIQDVVPGRPVRLTMPSVTSKACRLRLTGVRKDDPTERRTAIVTSGRFTVDTVAPEFEDKPVPVDPN